LASQHRAGGGLPERSPPYGSLPLAQKHRPQYTRFFGGNTLTSLVSVCIRTGR
jgi:hypothetical protein